LHRDELILGHYCREPPKLEALTEDDWDEIRQTLALIADVYAPDDE